MRINLQVREAELYKRERGELACLNCGAKRIRIQTRPVEPFWKRMRNAPGGPIESEHGSGDEKRTLCEALKELMKRSEPSPR